MARRVEALRKQPSAQQLAYAACFSPEGIRRRGGGSTADSKAACALQLSGGCKSNGIEDQAPLKRSAAQRRHQARQCCRWRREKRHPKAGASKSAAAQLAAYRLRAIFTKLAAAGEINQWREKPAEEKLMRKAKLQVKIRQLSLRKDVRRIFCNAACRRNRRTSAS